MRGNLQDLARRAERVRRDISLRHTPNEHDLRIAAEHAKIMERSQYETIKPDKEQGQ